MLLLLFFSFLAGLATILAPCIWPLLPIILSSSLTGQSHKRPLGIALGVTLSFAIFTLTVSSLVRAFHFDPNILRTFSVIVLLILGISMVIPRFSIILESLVSKISGRINISRGGGGFAGGLTTGLALGIVWSPCAGPILAAITTLAATGGVTSIVILITLAYSLGAGIPLFLFGFGSQKLLSKSISPYTGRIQQIFGIFMILTAIAIYTNYDRIIQLKILDTLPALNSTINSFESNPAVTGQLNSLTGKTTQNNLGNAPDFIGFSKWLNLPDGKQSLSLADLKGKVVLVDFWTYTCINCIRTLPYVTSWYDKYHKDGFVVVGVHTPEFEFEKDTGNVLSAIKQFNIHYPVVQDNNYSIWNAYSNQYWPAEYLIDAQGKIRDTHFGEGDYDKTEKTIQDLLKEAGSPMNVSLTNLPDQTPTQQLSPESYLGTNRMEFYYPNNSLQNGTYKLSLNETIPLNSFSLGGSWIISGENASSTKGSTLNYHFYANKVFLVIKPSNNSNPDKIKVFLDGRLVDPSRSGADVKDSQLIIDSDRLYSLIDLKGAAGNHTLKLEFENDATQVFAFTFG